MACLGTGRSKRRTEYGVVVTPCSAPPIMGAKKPQTKTFHKGHRPPALTPEQTGVYLWVPDYDPKGELFWRLKKDTLTDIPKQTSSHDSSTTLQRYRESKD